MFRFVLPSIALAIVGISGTAEPPFRAADGLFDLSHPKTLGLSTIPAIHVEIHHATEDHGFRFSHHPSLAVFNNRLYCSWSSGRGHEDRPGQRVLISSSDDGEKWSSPKTLAAPKEGSANACVAAGFHVHEETLVAYYTIRHDYPEHNLYNPKNGLFAVESTDGANWTRPTGDVYIEVTYSLPEN